MIKIFFFLLALFVNLKVYTQSSAFEINPERFSFIEMEGMADYLQLKNQNIYFGYSVMEDSIIVASFDNKNYTAIGFILNEYFFNQAKMHNVNWRNDSIFVSSEMPYRATINSFEFIYDKKSKFFKISEIKTFDPSMESLNKADSCLEAGNIKSAIDFYYGVMYPHAYMNEGDVGIRLMEKSHEKALYFFKSNEFDSAIYYVDLALNFWPNSVYTSFTFENELKDHFNNNLSSIVHWTQDQLNLWLGDYGLFLYKAKKYKESIEHNAYLNKIMPELAGPYLQLADSYYDSGDKKNAKLIYKKYADLKKSQGKEKDIPKRVKERMK